MQVQEYHEVAKDTAVFSPLAERCAPVKFNFERRHLIRRVSSKTNEDGRCMDLWPKKKSEEAMVEGAKLKAGKLYKVVFKTKEYFESTGRKCFYPWVEVWCCSW